ncbi:MAG: hypothetical protein K8R77_14425, partial [Anaerolineaceae bacterium]|nr:hypothetical protein [Anaerolineaceae bacterium]
ADYVASLTIIAGQMLERIATLPHDQPLREETMMMYEGIEIEKYTVSSASAMVGKTLIELDLRNSIGLAIIGIQIILGERFDEDPFLIFRLRGRTQEQVMAALRQRRAGDIENAEDEAEEQEAVLPLEEQMAHYWESPTPLEEFSVSIRPPAIEMPLLKRLGEAKFVPAPGLESLLRDAYLAISQKAVEAAYRETNDAE